MCGCAALVVGWPNCDELRAGVLVTAGGAAFTLCVVLGQGKFDLLAMQDGQVLLKGLPARRLAYAQA